MEIAELRQSANNGANGRRTAAEPLARESVIMSSVRIRSSEQAPPSPYRIQHRGYWFYVDDSELESKMFFEALVAAYSSRVGSKEAHDEKPQIVLPLGGG